MSSFLFGFAGVLLLSLGARDQVLVARLAGRTGPAVLVAGWIAAVVSASAMAWAGAAIADRLAGPSKPMLVAFALVAAAFELAWPNREHGPKEPTHSAFAAFVVLLARQITDAGRFLVFALAAATALPWLVAAGGALGGGLALTVGHIAGANLERAPLRAIRLVLAGLVLLSAAVIGLSARGMV
ncbi:hypothetical protein MKP08_01070 [Erythrobacter sp. LQ02-29]|uniref:hypothetical protein n=1 Tax=Erythrobacter sp. LQ02-29 TaxID=2920384 RepID=UPI001F4E93F6|nr:hypothetical protein [Erythrobacter sp. LQ02-29]MCP9221341.1 hypothetical protein [Erythrobacter sp. LQ02-29]